MLTADEEAALVQQAQTDTAAFAELYDLYVERIYAYLYRQAGDAALAQDLTAATFEKALRGIGGFRWQGVSFAAWLYRIARNELIANRRRLRPLAPFHENLPAAHPSPEQAAQSSAEQQALRECMQRLSAGDQELLRLRYYEELDGCELAQVLGISENAVYVRLHRALAKLRQALATPAPDSTSEGKGER